MRDDGSRTDLGAPAVHSRNRQVTSHVLEAACFRTAKLREVERLYDRTVRYDRFSSASLLTGEALIATGVWLRFLRRPAASRVHLSLSPRRCSVTLSF